jgi:hypothetical protein
VAAPVVADLAAYLKMSDFTAETADLTRVLASATEWVERRCGPFEVTAFSRVVVTGGGRVYLAVPALVTVDTITDHGGTERTASVVDTESSVVYTSRGSRGPWTFTGTHGYATSPAIMTDAVLALAKHWWGAYAGTRRENRTDGTQAAVMGGYAIPHSVEQLVQQVPGSTVPIA